MNPNFRSEIPSGHEFHTMHTDRVSSLWKMQLKSPFRTERRGNLTLENAACRLV
eukprot:COSAG02_NODE_809_length_16922_cov_11.295013_10_plen_54_part_00